MSIMEDILTNQQQILNAIEQVYTNFKKDGSDRKTADYIRRRVDTLDKYWEEFQSNHVLLCGKEHAKSHTYFTNNQYEFVKERYENIRAAISNYQIRDDRPSTPILKPATPLGIPGPSRQPSPQIALSQGTSSKTDEMLRKQTSNFKAFEHTVSNINLDLVTEKWEFDHLLRAIQSRWSIIDAMHWELDSELGGRSPDYDTAFFAYEAKYNDIIKSINRKMWSVSHREQSTPHVEIPSFSGSYHQWTSFKDLFTETIHGNPTLSNAQKMQFLKTKVKGEAERLIHHLPITSDNYSICWDILNHRYNNKRLIFRSHIDILLNIPVVQQTSLNHIKRIHDTTLETLNAIKNLGVAIESWDPLLVHLLSQKLDTETHNEYIATVKQPRELPNLQEFLLFLEGKFTSLESSRKKFENPTKIQQNNNNSSLQHFGKYHRNFNKQSFPAHSRLISQQHNKANNNSWKIFKCGICKTNEHCLYYCRQFLNMTPYLKRQTVLKLSVCENCLYSHNGKRCISEKRCTKCNGMHNTILHEAFQSNNTNNYNASTIATTGGNSQKFEPLQQVQSNSHVSLQRDVPEVLLATAMLKVQTYDGTFVNMRALIDQGSQTSLITEHAAQLLGVPRLRCRGVISGIGAKESNCKGAISIKCVATVSNFEFQTDVYIMKNLVKRLPNYSFDKPSWSYLDNISLADPEFHISRPVDLLLGADIYSIILLEGVCRAGDNVPIAQNTRLGWILTGNVKTLQCNVIINNLEEIQKFWEIEDICEDSDFSIEHQKCIEYYKATTTRQEDGRYQVRLPLKSDFSEKLGESKFKAIAQFRTLENKLKKHSDIATKYKLFINEYRSLGHMIPALSNMNPDRAQCVLTHHCVQSNDDINSKFRVVFNASCKTTSGKSLNDVMESGPNLQQDLQSLIIKWRQYRFAFTADIEKMFRQIWIHPDDQQLLKIVWRDSPQEHIKEYQLTTVTYGTTAAPFLAMMTLKQLAHDEKNNYPNSNTLDVLKKSFYMDDLVHGCHTIEEAKILQQNLIKLLTSGGFHLRKWKSNATELLQEISQDTGNNFNFKQSEQSKTLGLGWDSEEDVFTFQLNLEPIKAPNRVTKRTLLSDVSKLFDPLGWLSPLSIKLKIIFQQVWAADIRWDDPVPSGIYEEWLKVRADIHNIKNIKLPRWIQTLDHGSMELHGFSDSSLKAYSCVIYCRVGQGSQSSVVLLVGKTRLVPASKVISLPRLELCGALLLSKLMNKVKKCLNNQNIKIYGWVDSMVVLGWLNGDPTRWKAFVANRVRQITENMPPKCWRYVRSDENPADSASRGLSAAQLKENNLWWRGPTWLSTFNDQEIKMHYSTDDEVKFSKHVNIVTQQQTEPMLQAILSKYSTFNKAVRVVAWVRRFIYTKKQYNQYLSVEELKQASLSIIKSIQQLSFEKEIFDLQHGHKIHRKSQICELRPYLDQDEVLRVGGRLRHANLDPDMKNPIIIPHNSRLAELLIDQAHQLTYHGGPRLTSAYLRQRYWIVGGNRATKKRLRLCIKCRRQEPTKHHQLMGDLPSARINPTRPFHKIGIDYTGHVYIKASAGRGIKTMKGYVAVFTCMATKAVHLELVSDLTSSAFLAALRRMAARRGIPSDIYSDNGTNFIGADKVLQQEYEEMLKAFDNEFYSSVADMGITWHFNAPSWPSASGLCEAAVKSLKFHLKRVVGEQKLTYEEFTTVLTQLEGCLNSRPLCPLTEDPEDLNYLTPSHFLSSGPILTIFETERDLRTRWHLTQKIFQDIWKRWQHEYLTNLSARSKWRQPQNNIKLNDVVIIHNSNLPAGKWALGRVVDLHPGQDGFVRVVTLQTKSGYVKRPIVKLSILPVHQEIKEETENSTQQVKTRTARNRKYNFASVASAILLFFLTFITNTCGTFTITPLRNGSAFFFDKVTNMHEIRDDWRLVVYYDMNPYWEGNAAVIKYTEYLENICSKIRKLSHCDGVMYQLKHDYSELQHYNSMLLEQEIKTHRRTRGLINGIGNIANKLFGILDSDFADKYQQDIELIRKNQRHLARLWSNQTSVVEAEFNVIKRVESVMEQHHKSANQKILKFEQSMNVVRAELQNSTYINEFTLTAMITNNILNKLRYIQDYLLDSLTDVFHGKINIHLLTPEQLQQELNIISAHLSKDLSLPIDHTDLSKLYKLVNIKARFSENYGFFELRIPLTARDVYDILKVIPIPKASGSFMSYTVPISEYLALNIKKDSFLSLSLSDLHECQELDIDTVLCRFRKPIYHMNSDQSLCEKKEVFESCKVIINTCKDNFITTNQLNTYFYFCCNKCYFKLLCEDQVTAIPLSNAGLLTLGQGCLIKSPDFDMYSHKQDSNNINRTADIGIPEIAPINHLVNISLPNLNVSTRVNNKTRQQLFAIQDQLDSMKRSDPLAENLSYHDIHHYVLIYVVVATAGIVGCFYVCRRARRGRSAHRRAGRTHKEDKCNSDEKCVDVELRESVVNQCTSGEDHSELQDNFTKQRSNRSTSPVLQSVFTISDSRI